MFQSQGRVISVTSRDINGANGTFTAYDIYLEDGQKYDTTKVDHANKAGGAQTAGLPVTILWEQSGNYKKVKDLIATGSAPMQAQGAPAQAPQFQAQPAPQTQQFSPPPQQAQAQPFNPPPANVYQQGGDQAQIERISRGNALNAACDLVGNLYATAGDSLEDGFVLGKVMKFAEAFAPWVRTGQIGGAAPGGLVVYPQQAAAAQDAAAEAPQVAPTVPADPAAIAAFLAAQGQAGVMVGAGAVAAPATDASPSIAGALPPGF